MNEAQAFTDRVAPCGRFRRMSNLLRGLKSFFTKPAPAEPATRFQIPAQAPAARQAASGGSTAPRAPLKEPPVRREPSVAKEPEVMKEP
jgi:hypothetical protein